jgi:hypothetical protein
MAGQPPQALPGGPVTVMVTSSEPGWTVKGQRSAVTGPYA